MDDIPQLQPPEANVEFTLQWVDLSDDLEEFGRMGTC